MRTIHLVRPFAVHFDGISETQMALVEPFVHSIIHPILPSWVNVLFISMLSLDQEDADDPVYAKINVMARSREARLLVSSRLFELPSERQAHCLRHEMAHALIGQYADAIDGIISRYVEGAKERARVRDELLEVEEATVEDIATVLDGLSR